MRIATWNLKQAVAPKKDLQSLWSRAQINFIYSSPELAKELVQVTGGVADFPDVWNVSDHAPVVADFGTRQFR